jgi:hypothetical protein
MAGIFQFAGMEYDARKVEAMGSKHGFFVEMKGEKKAIWKLNRSTMLMP